MGIIMCRGLLLVLALVAGNSALANAETAQQILQSFGLLGTWANDCSRPPGNGNTHTVYSILPNGDVIRIYYSALGKIAGQAVLERIARPSSDQLSYRQSGKEGYADIVLQKVSNRIHTVSSQDPTGRIFVQQGKFTATIDPSAAGQESPWQTKCRE